MGRIKDLTGQQFGRLFIIREFHVPYLGKMKNRKTQRKLECKCECGHIFFPFKSNVLAGHTKSCQHCANSNNLTGKRIGKIEIVERYWDFNTEKKHSRVCYKIKCDCGNVFSRPSNTARQLKGIQCAKCPRKPKPLLTRKEAISFTNYKKHLKSKEKKMGQTTGYLKVIKFFGWHNANHRRYALYEMKCKCGNKIIRRGDVVGRIFSCGCLHKEKVHRGEDCIKASITNKEAAMIRELFKTGLYKGRQIAKMFNLSESFISHIKLGKTYITV